MFNIYQVEHSIKSETEHEKEKIYLDKTLARRLCMNKNNKIK